MVATVGIHPISTRSGVQSQLEDLKHLLMHPAVVGLGEVGIDCHHGGPLDQQVSTLEQLFRLADPEKPLVIHCRERDMGNLEAFETLFRVARRCLSSRQRIHFHSYDYTAQEFQQWLEVFPFTYLGISTKIFRPGSEDNLTFLLRHIPLTRVLLESDAPYQSLPRRFHCRTTSSTPNMLRAIAERVADVYQLPLDAVLWRTGKNCCSLYRLG